MKNILIIFLCIFSLSAFGQNKVDLVEPDARLSNVYSADYLTRLQTANPFLLQRWNFYLDNAFFVTENPADKGATYPTIEVADLDNINILLIEKEQKIHHDFKARTYYQIAGTTKMLVYRSGEEFRDALNEHLGRGYPKKN
jgi:hypothetical protein